MLDPSEPARLMVVLRERQAELGLGPVVVSHHRALIGKARDRIVVLGAGRVVEQDHFEVVNSAPRRVTARRLADAVPRLIDVHEPDGTQAIATEGGA